MKIQNRPNFVRFFFLFWFTMVMLLQVQIQYNQVSDLQMSAGLQMAAGLSK